MGVLDDLREQMALSEIDAVVIPTNDPHFCEMPPRHYARREFISGFTGSAGTAVVTSEQALLWTDGRYFLQADKELSDEWTLMKAGMAGVPQIHVWLAENLTEGKRIGLDPFLHSVREAQQLKDSLEASGKVVVYTKQNLVDSVWKKDRPSLCTDPVRLHPIKFAGLHVDTKLQKLAENIKQKDADAALITKLDDIAWLLNIRGSDVPQTPLFVSYLIVRKDATATLYADTSRVTPEVGASLSAAMVAIADYSEAMQDVRSSAQAGTKFWLDPSTTSVAALNAASEEKEPVLEESSVPLAKSKKTEEEMNGMRSAYLKDGVNWAKFLCWLDETIIGDNSLTEVEISDHLEAIRAELDGYLGPSFETIAAAGPNAAVIHYRPTPAACSSVTSESLFLCDAGCQFEEGTTDITRTTHRGQPSNWEKECFTRVLKGHIALDEFVFPQGTTGSTLDSHARKHLWSVGLDYRHGTGHGVGAGLCVHEGPQGISIRVNYVPLEPGMVLSNEPGYYEDNAFGIRIESIIAVRASSVAKGFLEFEPLTYVPMQKKMIDVSLLTDSECDWVDQYHLLVREKVSPLLDEKTKQW